MRMWMINPEFLCRNHLLGEHGELHKHKHIFEKRYSIKNRILKGQIEPSSMKIRHDELVKEMIKRGYKHNSQYEMPDISYLSIEEINFKVDRNISIHDLYIKCDECKKRIKNIL